MLCYDHNTVPTLTLPPSLPLRYPPRLGRCSDAPPAWAGVRVPSHGQPRPVRAPPVLPAADHAGLPVWSRSAHVLCSLWTSKRSRRFQPRVRPPKKEKKKLACLARVRLCVVTRNPLQPGDLFLHLFIYFTVDWLHNRGRRNPRFGCWRRGAIEVERAFRLQVFTPAEGGGGFCSCVTLSILTHIEG